MLIGIIAGLGYAWDTFKGRAKPNRVSFFLWFLTPTIAFSAQVSQGVGLLALQTLSQGLLPLLILFASFKSRSGAWKITKFDICCGLLSVVGIALWLITKSGNLAIVFSIVADSLAALPTMVKAYKSPESEVLWLWLVTAIGAGISLLTITTWTFANYGFIGYLLLSNLITASLIAFRPRSTAEAETLASDTVLS